MWELVTHPLPVLKQVLITSNRRLHSIFHYIPVGFKFYLPGGTRRNNHFLLMEWNWALIKVINLFQNTSLILHC